ncbi:VanW family protein [Bacillus litorisediminis]|uniref:VanW family protein n=1 Tax=Bacillus litorisediminis TaxID=2922713 RepID=UPI001FAE157A|nr:VanW family protein [Bacillus litorisediminis]
MKVWRGIQLFVSILLGSVLFICIFQLSSFAYEKIFNQAFPKNTVIRSAVVSGLPKDDSPEEKGTGKDDLIQADPPQQTANAAVISLVRSFPDISQLSSIEFQIEPGQAFSMLQWAENESPDTLSDEDLSNVASLLWEAVLSTDLKVIERHTSKSLPAGIQPGLEAKIDRTQKLDFRFFNDGDSRLAFKLVPISKTSLHLTITGLKSNEFVRYHIIQEKVLEPRTIVQYVSADEEKAGTTQPGKKGSTLIIRRDYFNAEGEVVHSEVVAEDTYLPIYEIQYSIKP